MPDLALTEPMRAFVRSALPSWDSAGWVVEPVHNGGSGRVVLRLRATMPTATAGDPVSVILVAWTDQRPDNDRFLLAHAILERHHVRVPHLLQADAEQRLALVEDLGSRDLWCQRGQPWPRLRQIYGAALETVRTLHGIRPSSLSAGERDGLMPGFDSGMYRWEQDYFFDQCVNPFSTAPAADIDGWRAHPSLAALADELGAGAPDMVHRDFQSQNLMLRGDEVVLVDFQGLRPGWAEYDIASLLCDPYVALGRGERLILFEDSARLRGLDPADPVLLRRYAGCAVQRLMQALGAYGNLGRNCAKPRFLEFIPPATKLLRETLADLPELRWLEDLLGSLQTCHAAPSMPLAAG